MIKKITKLQIEALVLWSQNYTLKEIAQKMGVSFGTIKDRVTVIKRLYPTYYSNAQAIRDSLKKVKRTIHSPLSWEDTGKRNKENYDDLLKHVNLYRDYSYDFE